MKPAQLLLAYQRLVERERELRDEIERVESLLTANPDVVAAEEALERGGADSQAIELRVRDSDRDREAHRTRMRWREKELMSGRIRSPTDLMQLSEEVKHLKTSFAEVEEVQLRLMDDAEAADVAVRQATEHLEEAQTRQTSDEPTLRRDLETCQAELAAGQAGGQAIWAQVPG